MLDNQGYLKLKADDNNDLKVFAAYLQDSITVPQDIKYLEKNQTFICVFNRFMWEDAEKGFLRDNKRVRSALKFNDVLSVKSKNIDTLIHYPKILPENNCQCMCAPGIV